MKKNLKLFLGSYLFIGLTMSLIGSFTVSIPLTASAKQTEFKMLVDDSGQTIADFASAQKACQDYVGGIIPDLESLRKIVRELGSRLKPAYYWSTTISTDCGAKECRMQIEMPSYKERSENAENATGAAICVTQHEEG